MSGSFFSILYLEVSSCDVPLFCLSSSVTWPALFATQSKINTPEDPLPPHPKRPGATVRLFVKLGGRYCAACPVTCAVNLIKQGQTPSLLFFKCHLLAALK